MNIGALYQQATLAMAAYAEGLLFEDIEEYKLVNKSCGMSHAQAEAFAKKWSVVAQYTDSIGSVSATVFNEVVPIV